MSDGIIKPKEIPLIGGVLEQKLIITFKKQPDGTGNISFHFEPDIEVAISPEQQAAVNVANATIEMLGLNNTEGLQNAESTNTEQ